MNEKFYEALENNVCPECGAEIIEENREGATLCKCSKCEWAIVSTLESEESLDETIYTIYILADELATKDKMLKIGKIVGWNIIKTKHALSEVKTYVTEGTASELSDIIKALRDNDINHSVEPEYKY